ncbi:MAG TPA: DNA-3-methyladenine glycosylase 2 family protein [Exiguobacterium sp.]|uniref:DNA-3-methyladenine glycosylase family protein n=1 Tax=Exiguobacterium sp. TaxID=44751 RepID=UPI000EF0D47D|nr:DNA-3-methyladenine glycosylase 2 family protein [Exiguobacterium sp.]HCN59078.1 DNA-3-methyladenine glycosylase 2 family protein [Exiguobacterium sp.]
MWQENLRLEDDYDFAGIRKRLRGDRLQVEQDGRLFVPVMLPEGNFIGQVEAVGSRELLLSGEGPQEPMVQLLRRRFRLDTTNPSQHLSKTSLSEVVATFGAERLVLDINPFTALIRSIIHQQINLAFAQVLMERFCRTFGTEQNGVIFPPTAEQLMNVEPEQLRALQLSGRKVDYLLGAARAAINFDRLTEAPDATIAETLIALKGVGPWTVQNVLMFGYGREDLFPASDIGILRAFERLHGTRPSVEEAVLLAEEFTPYRSHAAYLLWRSIE